MIPGQRRWRQLLRRMVRSCRHFRIWLEARHSRKLYVKCISISPRGWNRAYGSYEVCYIKTKWSLQLFYIAGFSLLYCKAFLMVVELYVILVCLMVAEFYARRTVQSLCVCAQGSGDKSIETNTPSITVSHYRSLQT